MKNFTLHTLLLLLDLKLEKSSVAIVSQVLVSGRVSRAGRLSLEVVMVHTANRFQLTQLGLGIVGSRCSRHPSNPGRPGSSGFHPDSNEDPGSSMYHQSG